MGSGAWDEFALATPAIVGDRLWIRIQGEWSVGEGYG